jgi:[methyl-Co(III) methanol-specific corrinoid protein]:coenzyme M methyltransferase
MSLAGNVNAPKALLQGTPEDVRREVRYAAEAGVQIVGPECAVPLATPNANLRAIADALAEST